LSEDKNIKIARLISLEKKTREAKSKDELNFIVVNETREIIDYTTSFLLLKSATDKFHINAISDIASIDRTAPLVTFVESVINHKTKKDLKEIESIDLEQFSKKIKKQKPKNIPQYLLCIPIFSPQRGLQGYLLLARNKNFNDNENELVQHLSRTYGHAYNTFLTNFSIKNFLKKNFTGKKRWITISVIILIFLFPVRMTSTAPVEVVAKNPFLITSPFDGVVKKIIANNNDQTKPGDLLVLLEDIDLSNEFNLAKQSLQVAEKELLRTRQSSFTDNEQKSRLAELVAQVDLKRVELKSAERKLKNSKIYSEKKGVVIVDRKSDWQGKPVAVGEKILTIADPNNIEFLIWLPVKDSIVINQDANTNIFLDINPMSSYKGNIIRSTYEPELSPEEVLSYKLISSFKGNRDTPRIGLRGTAKVYGNRTILFYYLFRKPITFIRQLIGI
tara:strand:- start:222 stop:1559 length:1338 start_codon:yes stop_codon:yes gene_type:complete